MIRLVPMPEKDFEPFMQLSMHDQAQGQVKAGVWKAEEAEINIQKLRSQFLPDGLGTPNHHFYMIEEISTGRTVGVIWYMVAEEDGARQIFALDILIYAEYRRQGYGSQAFRILEEHARKMGIHTVSLHVFADNLPARAMYEKLGYSGTKTAMSKKLNIVLDLDEDIRNQDWLKNPSELVVQDMVTEKLKKEREERERLAKEKEQKG